MTTPGKIFSLIPKIMQEVGAISKDRTNDFQKYKFRGIEDMYQAIHPALVRFGVFCAPEVLEDRSETIEKTKFNAQTKVNEQQHSYRTLLRVRHRFYADDASYVDVVTLGEGIDTSDKSANKAMSAAMKYAFIELLSIPTADIEDADRTSPEAAPKQRAPILTPQGGPYRVPFGQFVNKTLEEIPLDQLKSYVIYIEDKAAKDKKPLTGTVLDFVSRSTDYIGAIENAIITNANLNYSPDFDK